MHIIRHVLPGIILHGPVHSWSMYVYERMNSWICRRVTNRCHPEATVMETYRVSTNKLYHFTVVCLVPRPLCESKAGGDLGLIQTFKFFSYGNYAEKNASLHKNKATLFTQERKESFIKATSSPASLPSTTVTVNRYIWHLCSGNLVIMCQAIVDLIPL